MSHLPPELLIAFNEQITHERRNQATYTAMASELDSRNLIYLARYLYAQADGEYGHAKKLISFLADRDDAATIETVAQPFVETGRHTSEYFKLALATEQATTAAVNALYQLAKAMDPQAEVFLQWFVSEQVEEEKNVGEIVDRFERSKNLGDEWMDAWMKENLDRLTGKA